METQELFLIVYLSVGFGFATCAHTNYLLGIRDGEVPEEDRLSGGQSLANFLYLVFLWWLSVLVEVIYG